MPANSDPIYSRLGDIQFSDAVLGPTASTVLDGSAATGIYQVFQADATNGGFIRSVRAKAVGSPAATVMRLFICSNTSGAFTAGTTNTVANTTLFDEVSMPALTASNTLALPVYEIPLNIALPPGHRLLVSFGTSTGAAGTGYKATAVGGKY